MSAEQLRTDPEDVSGLFITTIAGKTAVVRVEWVYDGGMVEFFDAVTGEPRGCAGRNWWLERRHAVRLQPAHILPVLPDEGAWL